MLDKEHQIICGDCRKVLPELPDNSINLVLTSPPYANRRKDAYGGIPEKDYVQWFIPIAQEIYRVLSPTGSFFLNIKPHVTKGERSLYVFELVLALCNDVGFKLKDEFCWVKNPFPGKLSGRFKNAFEPVYHFTKSPLNKITFHPLACGTPTKPESIKRSYRKQCGAPANKSGMTGMNTQNIRHLPISRPSNVVIANNVSNQFMLKQHHPATFPEQLCGFFILSFSNTGDIVLDPFVGSGTTCVVAKKLNRKCIGIDTVLSYCELANERLQQKSK